MFLHRDAKWHESNKTVHKFIDKYVDEALERKKLGGKQHWDGSGRQRPVLLDAMAEQSDNRMQLRNEALQAFIAAHETTACLISNLFYMLARHPLVLEKLREEVLTLGDVPLDFEVPMKLKYIRNVINESKYSSRCIIETFYQYSLPQLSASTPSSPTISASPSPTPPSPKAAAQTANLPSTSKPGPSSTPASSSSTASLPSGALMPTISTPTAGTASSRRRGNLLRSAGDLAHASGDRRR